MSNPPKGPRNNSFVDAALQAASNRKSTSSKPAPPDNNHQEEPSPQITKSKKRKTTSAPDPSSKSIKEPYNLQNMPAEVVVVPSHKPRKEPPPRSPSPDPEPEQEVDPEPDRQTHVPSRSPSPTPPANLEIHKTPEMYELKGEWPYTPLEVITNFIRYHPSVIEEPVYSDQLPPVPVPLNYPPNYKTDILKYPMRPEDLHPFMKGRPPSWRKTPTYEASAVDNTLVYLFHMITDFFHFRPYAVTKEKEERAALLSDFNRICRQLFKLKQPADPRSVLLSSNLDSYFFFLIFILSTLLIPIFISFTQGSSSPYAKNHSPIPGPSNTQSPKGKEPAK